MMSLFLALHYLLNSDTHIDYVFPDFFFAKYFSIVKNYIDKMFIEQTYV